MTQSPLKLFWLCAALLLWPVVSLAQSVSDPMQALVQQVQKLSTQQAAQLQAREQRFIQARNQQAQLLQHAQAQARAAQSRADKVRAAFKANQESISKLQKQLANAIGDRGQTFSTIHDAARAFSTMANSSLVSAQYPKRAAQLAKLAQAAQVPNIDDIHQLWLLMMRQIVDGGQVATFPAQVVGTDGQLRQTQVTRIGEFTAIADGNYLALQPDTTQLAVLRQQPDYRSEASNFQSTDAAIAPILVDPSLGKLLRQQAQRPTLGDRIHQGGSIGYIIMVAGITGLIVALFQLSYLLLVDVKVRRQLQRVDSPSRDNPLGRVLACLRDEKPDEDPEVLETRLSEAVLRETPKLERFQALLRMLVAAGPLLGLLGTVIGMIIVFQAITEVGAGDPKLMAGGISVAMVNTVLGLAMALPLLFINSILGARSRVLIQILDEQSAGLLAQRLEHLHGGR